MRGPAPTPQREALHSAANWHGFVIQAVGWVRQSPYWWLSRCVRGPRVRQYRGSSAPPPATLPLSQLPPIPTLNDYPKIWMHEAQHRHTHTRLRTDPYGPQERIKGQRMVKSFLRLLRQGFSRFVFSLILPKLRSWLIPRPLVFTANRGKKLKNSPWRFIPFEKRSLITYFICRGGCFACLEQYYFHIFHIMRRCVWLLFHVTSW